MGSCVSGSSILKSSDCSGSWSPVDTKGKLRICNNPNQYNFLPLPEEKSSSVVNLPPDGWLVSLCNGAILGSQHWFL